MLEHVKTKLIRRAEMHRDWFLINYKVKAVRRKRDPSSGFQDFREDKDQSHDILDPGRVPD